MSHARLTDVEPTPRVLFKRDRPRVIDQYINYFGGANGVSVVDPCGEAFLESFVSEGRPAGALVVEVAS